jgi:hypothetical protein
MATVALLGAGGKIGFRIAENLRDRDHVVRYVEVGAGGIAKLKTLGLDVTPLNQALQDAEMVIFAVPDVLIRKISHDVVPKVPSGTLNVVLDPAAPLAGYLPDRKDVAYFVTHPCHPSVFNYEDTEEKQNDIFGGVKAKQSVVCALMQGEEADYARGEKLVREIFAPVVKTFRITVEQMALLEPALAETLALPCINVIREGLEEVIRRGVPADAALAFILGHINVDLAILFGKLDAVVSDAATKAMKRGEKLIFKENWKEIFEPANVVEQVKAITQ